MSKQQIQVGSTSQSIDVFIQDSSSTTGQGLAGLAYNTSGLTAYYSRPKTAGVAITLATLAAITTAYSSGGFKEYDATNLKGWYRLDVPDAALVTGARSLKLHLFGAANMAPTPVEIELIGYDNQAAGLTVNGFTAAAFGYLGISPTAYSVGAAVSATSTTMVLAVGAPFLDNELQGATMIWSDTNGGYGSRQITANVLSTRTVTVSPAFSPTPSGTISYWIFATAPASGASVADVNVVSASSAGKLDIATGVWDALHSAHLTAGSFGLYLDAAISGVSTGGLSAATIADKVWDTVRSAHTTSGTYGEGVSSVQGNITGTVTSGVALTTAGIDALFDRVVADSRSLRQILRGYNAALMGISAGQSTTNPTFRNLANTKNVISAVMDSLNDRISVTLDLS